jgi:hypothetical protein
VVLELLLPYPTLVILFLEQESGILLVGNMKDVTEFLEHYFKVEEPMTRVEKLRMKMEGIYGPPLMVIIATIGFAMMVIWLTVAFFASIVDAILGTALREKVDEALDLSSYDL